MGQNVTDYSERYTTLENVKQTLGTTTVSAADDTFLSSLLAPASRYIDFFCNRRFVAIEETRYFDAIEDTDGRLLIVDTDLVAVTAIINGDEQTIPDTDYVLEPRNHVPKYGIRLKSGTNHFWTFRNSPEEAIAVTGRWGYSNGTPDAIEQACRGIVIYLYKKRANPFLQVGVDQSGLAVITSQLPDDVRDALGPFIRHAL